MQVFFLDVTRLTNEGRENLSRPLLLYEVTDDRGAVRFRVLPRLRVSREGRDDLSSYEDIEGSGGLGKVDRVHSMLLSHARGTLCALSVSK